MAVHDLRFGFDIQFAQLITQSSNRHFHLNYVELDQVNLLTEA